MPTLTHRCRYFELSMRIPNEVQMGRILREKNRIKILRHWLFTAVPSFGGRLASFFKLDEHR